MHAIFFATAIFLVQQLSELPELSWSFISFALFPVLFLTRFRLLGWFFLGLFWSLLIGQLKLSDRLADELEGVDVVVAGTVWSVPESFEYGKRFLFRIDESVNSGLPGKVRLGWYKNPPEIHAGQRWKLTIRLKKPHGFFNPGGFDYEGWLFRQGIRATGYVRPVGENRLLGWDDRLLAKVIRFREQIGLSIETVSNGDQTTAVIKALTAGLRDGISRTQWDLLRKTGTAHLIAISGLHVGLVSGLVFFASRKFFALMGIQRVAPFHLAAIIGIAAAFIYALLAGFALPTVRALVMVIVVMLAVIGRRQVSSGELLSTALIAVLLIDPLSIVSASFWLSFGAVALILFSFSGRVGEEKGFFRKQRIHFILAVGLMPFLLFYFQQVSLVAPVANLVAVPLVALLVVPIVLLGTLVLPMFKSVAELFFDIAGFLLESLFWFLGVLIQVPFASVELTSPPASAVFLALPGLVILFAPRGFPNRWLGGLMLLPLVFISQTSIRDGEFRTVMLDVGQGLSVVVQTADHLLVFDAGNRLNDRFDLGNLVVVPYLRSIGASRIDKLVISHGDRDHRGGAEAVSRAIEVDSFVSSEPERFDWANVDHCNPGERWRWDGVEFQFLNVSKAGHWSENDRSCVLRISSFTGSLLLTGDIEKRAESHLVKSYGEKLKSDVLVVPHHGSKSSSTELFLDAVDPQLALFPVGYRNRFGFPHRSVTHRYGSRGVAMFDSASHGAMEILFEEGSSVVPKSYRLQNRRYWHGPANNGQETVF